MCVNQSCRGKSPDETEGGLSRWKLCLVRHDVTRREARAKDSDHRWNRNPRLQPQKFSKLVL